MKNKLGCIGVILLILVMLARCSSCAQSNLENKLHDDGIYKVEIANVSSEDGDFILKGKTDAPDGSKILAQGNVDKSENEAESTDYGEYAKVKNHRFSVSIDASYLSDRDLKKGQKLKVRIFAVKNYSIKFDDHKITKKVQKIISKQIDPVTLTVNSGIADYYKDDSDEDDDSDSDDSDSGSDKDQSKADDKEEDKSKSESEESEDKKEDTEQSEDTKEKASSQSNTDTSSENKNSDTSTGESTNNSDESQPGKIYTGNSNKIIGNARTHKYHVPGQAGYNMNAANAVYFNSEEEAQAAGYVRSKR